MLMVDDPAVTVNITILGGSFAHGIVSGTTQTGGIYFRANADSSLAVDGTTFTDLGQSVCVHRDTPAGARITIKNCEIFNVATRQGDWAAMSVKGGQATVENCCFHDNGTDDNPDLDMWDYWTGNGPSTLILRNNCFDGGNVKKHPLVLAARSKINQDIENPNNTFVNYPDSHQWAPIRGTVPAGAQAFWGETGLDYVVTGSTLVNADATSGTGSLTIAPGQNIFFKTVDQKNPPCLIISGSFEARGTEAEPITFAPYPSEGPSGDITTQYLRGRLLFEHCVYDGLQRGIHIQAYSSLLSGVAPPLLMVQHCVFKNIVQNPICISGDAYDGNNALIDHCLIYGTTGSSAAHSGYDLCFKGFRSGVNVYRCFPRVTSTTIANNSGGGAYLEYSNSTFTNCIIFGNGPTTSPRALTLVSSNPAVAYSCVQGGFSGTGNIASDPLFADPDRGDYHLKSQAGRWDPSTSGGAGGWVTDGVTSPCIDAGDPAAAYSNEPEPNGGRINMGAYGNTAYASKSVAGTGGGDTTPPTAPSNLRVTGTTASSITIAWDASYEASGIEEYIIEIK